MELTETIIIVHVSWETTAQIKIPTQEKKTFHLRENQKKNETFFLSILKEKKKIERQENENSSHMPQQNYADL